LDCGFNLGLIAVARTQVQDLYQIRVKNPFPNARGRGGDFNRLLHKGDDKPGFSIAHQD
jgi:hypothetical protein